MQGNLSVERMYQRVLLRVSLAEGGKFTEGLCAHTRRAAASRSAPIGRAWQKEAVRYF